MDMGSQKWISLELLEKLLFFVEGYFLPGWDSKTDVCEREDREGIVPQDILVWKKADLI